MSKTKTVFWIRVDTKYFLDPIDLLTRTEGAGTEWVLYLCIRGDQVYGGYY